MTSFRIATLALILLLTACSFKSPDDRVRSYSQADSGFVVMKNSVRFARLEAGNAEAWEAQANLNINVCLTRTFGWGQMEPGIPFQMELSDNPVGTGHGQISTTLPEGCLDFNPTLKYPFAQKTTKYIKKYLIVRGMQDELSGLVRVKPIFIDPWNQQVLENWDENLNGPPQAPNLGPMQLRVQGFTLRKVLSREVVLDRDLKVYFRYPYVLSFNDHYVRLRQLNSPTSDSTWPETRFAITGVLLAPPAGSTAPKRGDLSGYRKIAGFSTTATSNPNGTLSSEIALQVDLSDIPFLDSRPQMVIDIVPLGNSGDAPDPVSMVFSFDPRIEQMTYQPEYSRLTAEKVLHEGPLKPLKLSGVSNLTLMVKDGVTNKDPLTFALNVLGVQPSIPRFQINGAESDLPGQVSSSEALAAIREDSVSPDFLKHFAYLYSPVTGGFPGIPNSSDQTRFLQAPDMFVQWARFSVVDQVDPIPEQVKADSQVMGVAANVYKQTMSNAVTGEGERSALGSEINELRGLGFNSFGTGRTWNWVFSGRQDKYSMREVTTIDSVLAQDGLSRVENFFADRLRVRLHGKFRDCLALKFTGVDKGEFLFCAKRERPLEESYFFVTDESRANVFSFLDFRNLEERQLVKLFRGEEVFDNFKDVLRDSHLNFRLEPAEGLPDLSSLPGVSGMRRSPNLFSNSDRLRGLVTDLVKSMGGHPPIGTEQLFAYFIVAENKPEQIFSSMSGQKDFVHLSQLLVSYPNCDRITYFKILDLLHTSLQGRGLTKDADWVLHFAETMSHQ